MDYKAGYADDYRHIQAHLTRIIKKGGYGYYVRRTAQLIGRKIPDAHETPRGFAAHMAVHGQAIKTFLASYPVE